ncbi:hypothetical protein ABPG72_021331 [Tetrahymena utriculariae]
MLANQVNTSWMLPDEQCWVEQDSKNNSEVLFKKAIIKTLDSNKQSANVIIIDEQGKPQGSEIKVSVSLLQECNKESRPQGWDDMVQMNTLNDAEILINVKKRFSQDLIFSYIGPTLIVMNPYKIIQQSFNLQVMNTFQRAVHKGESFQQSEYPPHVYALSANAYIQLFTNNKKQAIVISGESGAGKTENAKYSMKYITSLSDAAHSHNEHNGYTTNKKQQGTKQTPIEEKILGCNPILESFGNAKTVRNNNSSRFGKYVRIWIEKKKRLIQGAEISNYLLEKSRVTMVAEGERNYHIFYQFLAGVSQQILEEFKILRDPNQFNYLNQSSSQQAEGIDDVENFNEVQQSFQKLNFTSQEEKSIYSILAGILQLGNVNFDEKTYSEGEKPCSLINMEALEKAAFVLKVDREELKNCLVYKRRVLPGGKPIDSPISKQECNITRDSLARALYDKLFNWLVSKLNQNIMPNSSVNISDCLSLGLLDIFGFENFKVNSFEQLCINYTNEKLQQLYIVYVFKSEEAEFKAEGLNDYMNQIQFKDNQGIIDLISLPKKSIYDLLDDESTINTGSDESLLKKILKEHAQNQYLVNVKPHLIKDTFSIRHTAKDVEYNINGFRVKNKDEISDSINDVLSKTQINEIKTIWTFEDQQNSQQLDQILNQKISVKSKSNKFLGAKFRNQIKELMDELQSCDVHFIRCIKPNELKQKELFDENFVMLQIRYLGILESVRVRKEGFPSRFDYDIFYKRYYELCQSFKHTNPNKFSQLPEKNKKDLCTQLIDKLIKDLKLVLSKNVLFGKTKIYMKLAVSNHLDFLLLEFYKAQEEKANKIKKFLRLCIYKKKVFLKIKWLKEQRAKLNLLVKKFKEKQQIKQQKKLEAVESINLLYTMRLYYAFKIFKEASLKNKKFLFFRILDQAFKRTAKQDCQHVFTLLKLKFSPQQKANIIGNQIQQIDNLITDEEQQRKKTENQIALQKQNDPSDVSTNQSSSTINSNQKNENNISTPQNQQEYFHNILNENEEEQQQERNIRDEFSTNGLEVWPLMTQQEDQNERQLIEENKSDNLLSFFRNSYASQFSTLNPKQSYIDLEKPSLLPLDPDYEVQFDEFDVALMRKVEDNDFFSFCESYIVKSKKNFGKKMPPIKQIMSYSSSNLVDPLTQSPAIQNHAQLIFRSLLKLAKNRRSRFPPNTHIENIILMCYGTPEKMNESIFSSVKDENSKILENYASKMQTNSIQREPKPNDSLNQSHQSMGSTINQSAIQPNNNEEDEPNIKEILGNKIMQIVNNSHQPIRDETFMQVCKQIHNQPILDSQRILLQFFTELIGLFPPSDYLLIPLMSFFKYIATQSADVRVQKECKYIFVKLAKLQQSFNMIKMVDFTQYNAQFLEENKIFKSMDKDQLASQVLLKQITQFDFFYNHLQRVDSREQIPTDWEISIANEHKLYKVKIYLLNETSISVLIDQSFSVKQVRDQVLKELGLKYRCQYFGIVQSKISEGKHYEHFLKNNQKMLDALNIVINDTKFLEGYKKQVITKFYLRIKICYKLYKHDIDSAIMYFIQNAFDVRYNKYYLKEIEEQTLAAYHLFIEFGPYDSSLEKAYREKFQDFFPTKRVIPKSPPDLYQKVLLIYKQLEFESQNQARWKYLELLRTKDSFMSYQLEAHQFCIKQNGDKFQKNKEGRLVQIAIRPYQIVILDANNLSTLEVIELEQIETWGLNLSQRTKNNQIQQFFFLRVKNSEFLYVFYILYLQVANLLIHSYALKKSFNDEDSEYKECFLDILSILFDKEEQLQAE